MTATELLVDLFTECQKCEIPEELKDEIESFLISEGYRTDGITGEFWIKTR